MKERGGHGRLDGHLWREPFRRKAAAPGEQCRRSTAPLGARQRKEANMDSKTASAKSVEPREPPWKKHPAREMVNTAALAPPGSGIPLRDSVKMTVSASGYCMLSAA